MAENKNSTKDEIKLLKPKTDIVFQSLFNSNHKETTKAFAQALLGEPIDKITINEDKTLLREKTNDKLGILDLELDVNNNKKVDVEIQLVDKKNFVERLLFYFSKLYRSQIKKGSNYWNAKKVVIIAIIDFPLEITKEIAEMETIWNLLEKKRPDLQLTDYIEIRILELKKVKKAYSDNKNNEKAQWLLFLDDPNSQEVKEIMEKNYKIKDATFIVREMSEDEQMQRIADLREKAIMDERATYAAGLDKGIKQGIEQGKSEGIQKTKIEMVQKLRKRNIPISEIAEIVELSEDEVKKILKI